MRSRRTAVVWLTLGVGALFLVLAWLSKEPCLALNAAGTGVDWSGGLPFRAACYTDIIPLYGARGFDTTAFPYAHGAVGVSSGAPASQPRFLEYPVLTGMLGWLAAGLSAGYTAISGAGLVPAGIGVVQFFTVTALLLSACWLFVVWAVTRLAPDQPFAAVFVAASPVVALQAFTNWDALAVALAMGAMLAFAAAERAGPKAQSWWIWVVVGGALCGLGAAAKLFPALILVAVLLLGIRNRSLTTFLLATAGALGAWLVVNVPVAVVWPAAWFEFLRINTLRGVNVDSIYQSLASATGWSAPDSAAAGWISAALFVAGVVGAAVFTVRVATAPTLAQLVFIVLALFLLVNKVWSPQYSLWLLPFLVLALARAGGAVLVGSLAAWSAVEAALWFVDMNHFANPGAGVDAWLVGTVIVRTVVTGALVLVVVYSNRHDTSQKCRSTKPFVTGGDATHSG
ncbi:glycosyltransferase family 87 protein [Subtercola frigoramans]|uniref:Membrane protein n=1 Tax=Subtercola frigoramans TaxID=120298 RepID=A0ABS2L6G2_9MICO|nr:glycosyltransferase 87 family protein [Subtercola frigoramans]MBM7472692.1 putative membrane protein [Subtercola frigoramans]